MIYIESCNHRVLYSGDFSVRTMFGFNGMKLMPGIIPGILLLNAPNVYMEKKEWEEQFLNADKPDYEEDHYLWLVEFIQKNLRCKKNIYLYSRSVPRHLDLFYFLKNVFPEVPVVLEAKSRWIADKLSEMGYFVYGENIQEKEIMPDKSCIVVGQETSRPGCVSVSFDSYSLHASPRETVKLVEDIQARTVFLLHVQPNYRKKSLADILKETNSNISVTQAENGRKYYLKREQNMKHEQIFQEVMQKELEKAEEELQKNRGSKTRSMIEWEAIYGSFMYPDQHPRIAYQQIQKLLAEEDFISYEEYLSALRSLNLDSDAKRKYVISLVEYGMTLLKQALDGDTNAIQKYAEFTENLKPRDEKNRKMFFIGKYMVNFIILMDPDLKNEAYKPIVVTFASGYCDRLLRNIRSRLLKEYQMTRVRKKKLEDVLKDNEKVLSEVMEGPAELDSGSELERLRFMNDNYKNSLELVQAMFDELNEMIEETAADAKNAAIVSFYSTMNSDNYGNLLDSIEFVERRLAAIKEQKVKIPPQLLPLTIVFKQLLRFIKDGEITPIDTTGREFVAEAEDLAEYTYNGEAYSVAGEKKTVVVERPGWKFGNTVISLPTVREKEEGSLY